MAEALLQVLLFCAAVQPHVELSSVPVLPPALFEAQERKRAQREAEQRRKKEELEAMLRQREESFIVALP